MMRRMLCLSFLLLCLTAWSASAAGLLIGGDRTLAGRMNYNLTTGTSTAYALAITPAPTTWAYADGLCFEFRAHTANTGSATLNVNSIGARTIQKRVAGALTNLIANDIGTNQLVLACYEATNNVFQAMSLGAATGSGTVTSVATSGPLTGGPIVSTGTLGFDSSLAGTIKDGGVTDLTAGAAAGGKIQTMDNGDLQYTDGANTSILWKGKLTQFGLTWNVTVATCTGDSNSGKLTVNASNQIICAPDNGGAGGSGDVTDVGTCTTGACFNDATPGARLTYGPIAEPATPAAGKATTYVDSTSKNFAVKDDAGAVKHGVKTKAPTSGQFVTAIADDGTVTLGAPTKADVGLGNVDNTSDATKNAASVTLTNHAVAKRVVLGTPSANVITPNADTSDVIYNYALTAGTTIANPTASGGNPTDQQNLEFVFKTAAPQTLTWGTNYSTECGLPLPTGTTGDGTTYNHFLFQYSSTSTKWCLIATSKAPSRRVTTLASSTTFLCPADLSEQCEMQMTAASTTITFSAPTGGASNGDMLMFSLLCTSSQTLSWNAIFIASPNVPLPSVCPASTTSPNIYGFRYSSLVSKWQLIASN